MVAKKATFELHANGYAEVMYRHNKSNVARPRSNNRQNEGPLALNALNCKAE